MPGASGTYADGKSWWRVGRLWQLSRELPVFEIKVSRLASELEFDCWFEGEEPTAKAVLEHTRRTITADLTYPIILSQSGRVMDGMHRLSRAVLEGHEVIKVVQFEIDPEPDGIDE